MKFVIRTFFIVCLLLVFAAVIFQAVNLDESGLSTGVEIRSGMVPLTVDGAEALLSEDSGLVSFSSLPQGQVLSGDRDRIYGLDRYADARVISEKVNEESAAGIFSRIRLVETKSKYPYLRIEEILRKNADGSVRLIRQNAMAAGHILVMLDEPADMASFETALSARGLQLNRSLHQPGTYLVSGEGDVTIETVPLLFEKTLAMGGVVLVSEPDYVYWHTEVRPNDSRYSEQWAMETINMPQVWSATGGTSDVVVAVFDTGMMLTHSDFQDVRWYNEGEIAGNLIDDDGNGYVDDWEGWHFYYDTNDPDDLNGHGTHVHGIIGAVGNNMDGVSGVGWCLQTLPVAFMGADGSGFSSDAIDGLYYVKGLIDRGVPIRVINHSWGGGAYSELLLHAFESVATNALHVTAAGNSANDNDASAFYPAGFDVTNMVSVANSTSSDQLNVDSNYGATSVDLAAPGTSILSTIHNGFYGYKSGTSMAAPHVSGVLALLLDAYPGLTISAARGALLDGVAPRAALSGKVATGGRLDALGAFLAIGPVLAHTPHTNVDSQVSEYQISVQVLPGAGLLGSDGVHLFWDLDASLSHVRTNQMVETGDGVFSASIPAQPQGDRIYYWIEAAGLDDKVVTDPVGAPAAVHSFAITYPVTVYVQATPGAYGAVSPAYGEHEFAWGAQVAFSAELHTQPSAGARWRNLGWDGAGSIPATGGGQSFLATIQATSFLAWKWKRQYSMGLSSSPAGFISQTNWFDEGAAAATVLAPDGVSVGNAPYRFTGWVVDGVRQTEGVTRSANPAAGITMGSAVHAVAAYVPEAQDTNGEGIPDWWQLFYLGELANAGADPDGDGFTNLEEFQDYADPNDPGSFPSGPAVTVMSLPSEIGMRGPWSIRADAIDPSGVSVVVLYWREVGSELWQTLRMDPVVGASGTYESEIGGSLGPGASVEYRVYAEDGLQNSSMSPVYQFSANYPVLQFGEIDSALSLTAGGSGLIQIVVTNTGTADWNWRSVIGYSDDVMQLSPADWSSGGMSNQWHVSDREFVSAPYAWFCGDPDGGLYNNSMDASLYSPVIHVGSDATLRFQHWPEMEYDGQIGYENHYWDGAVVEISTNGGISYFAIEPEGGYPYLIRPNDASPFEANRPCFGGVTGGWNAVAFDLAEYAGGKVRFRFRFGTDRWVAYRGWFIDDISVDWDTSWLSAMFEAGVVGPGEADTITWRVDTAGLAPGAYHSVWSVASSDNMYRRVSGSVLLEVVSPRPGVIHMQGGDTNAFSEGFVLRWHSETGKVYSLLTRSNLLSSQWITIAGYSNLLGGGEMSYTGKIDSVGQQFYRVLEDIP